MPAMTEPGATESPGVPGPEADDPRRLVLADLVARLAAGLTTRARHYEATASRARGELQQALDRLGRAKRAQVADLAPAARALGAALPPAPTSSPAQTAVVAVTDPWGVELAEAFQGERDVEWTSRELAVLAEDPALKVLAARLAGGVARDGEEIRKLYLRYS
jgi:hypothetical protein